MACDTRISKVGWVALTPKDNPRRRVPARRPQRAFMNRRRAREESAP